jgi:hypothetical protein
VDSIGGSNENTKSGPIDDETPLEVWFSVYFSNFSFITKNLNKKKRIFDPDYRKPSFSVPWGISGLNIVGSD